MEVEELRNAESGLRNMSKSVPLEERYSLTGQIRRSSRGVVTQIKRNAPGHQLLGRKRQDRHRRKGIINLQLSDDLTFRNPQSAFRN